MFIDYKNGDILSFSVDLMIAMSSCINHLETNCSKCYILFRMAILINEDLLYITNNLIYFCLI